jgi:osmotically-inducible protein OsmY
VRRSLFSLAVISLAFLCASALAGKSPERTPDAELAGKVRVALHATFGTAAREIGVVAQDGFVSLYGDVPSDALRVRAEQIASGVAGVRAVSNELGVEHHR